MRHWRWQEAFFVFGAVVVNVLAIIEWWLGTSQWGIPAWLGGWTAASAYMWLTLPRCRRELAAEERALVERQFRAIGEQVLNEIFAPVGMTAKAVTPNDDEPKPASVPPHLRN